MKRLAMLLLSGFCALTATATEPLRAQDFAEAIPLTAEAGRPIQEAALPDAVYQRVVSPGLHDLAVFDASGAAVPHVFCETPPEQRIVEATASLTVFPVQLAQLNSQGATAEVRTDSGNTIAITVPGSEPQAPVAVAAYDLDLGAIEAPVVALQVRWHSPTGLSEVHFKVEQGSTSQPWQVVAADAVLKRVTADGQTLEQAEIALPAARYQSLRLTPRDAAGTVIDSVQARTREISTVPADLSWFTAAQTGPADEPKPFAGATQGYDSQRQAPVTLARIKLVEPNTRYGMRLQSRSSTETDWQTVWTGEAFYLVTPDGERRSGEISLPPNRHRHWRLLADGAAAPFAPLLELAYTPQKLRFTAQGQGPYLLAYGNASAIEQRPRASCDELLKSLLQTGSADEAAKLIGRIEYGAVKVLAGTAALQPPPPDTATTWRRWLLWGVLAVAVLLLLGMARKLFADLNQSDDLKP